MPSAVAALSHSARVVMGLVQLPLSRRRYVPVSRRIELTYSPVVSTAAAENPALDSISDDGNFEPEVITSVNSRR